MEQAKLEEIIKSARLDRLLTLNLVSMGLTDLPESIGSLVNLNELYLGDNKLTNLPESISNLANLTGLYLAGNTLTNLPASIGRISSMVHLTLDNNKLTSLPESIGNLVNISTLNLSNNLLISLPKSIGDLTNLSSLNLHNNRLTNLPESIGNLSNLKYLNLNDNPTIDLSPLKDLGKKLVEFLDVTLPRRYRVKLSDWEPEWLLSEHNAKIRSNLIAQIGYERICSELNAITIDTWREYRLLKIDGVEKTSGYGGDPLVLLKMTCPSTAHIHILRVPPDLVSAEEAITWVNHGIHPDKFSVQT